jgi:hypothetical protein
MLPFRTPGRLLCGTVNTPDFAPSLGDYRGQFGLDVVAEGRVTPADARAWGAPAQVACPWALLAARGGSGGFLRLVGGTAMPGYRPLASYGWVAFEIAVADAFGLRAGIDETAFRVLGEPKRVPGFDSFIPFQVAGRAGEVLYLNTVLKPEMAALDLPVARAPVDSMFIAVLAAEDRAATLAFHVAQLGFAEGPTWSFPYSMINQSFGLPADHETTLTMTCMGRIPAAEIDQYPSAALHRVRSPGELPPGNAMVTMAVASLDSVRAPFIEPPVVHDGPLYGGARAACLWGPSGELIELVEVG